MPRYVRLGSETAVNSTYVRSQAQAETSRLANGNFITVWTDADFNTTAGRFVRAQMLQPDGTAVGGELTLFSGSFVSNPNVAGLANGGFAMTWISSTSIRVQIFDASGVATAPAFTATPTSGASSVQRPEIAGLEGGGFAVIWHDSRTTGADISGSGIRMRQYDASGTAVGGEVLVNVSTAGNQADSSVSYLVGGGFVVTWTDRGASGSGAPWLVRAQVFAADGTRVGGEITINEATTGVSSVESSVTSLSGGGFAVSWYESSFTGTSGHRIRMFDASGAPVGSVILVESGLNGTQTGPVLTALTDGSLAISWVADISPLSDGAGRGIFVQIFGADGIADGPPMQVNTQANGDQIDPAIVALSDGRFAVTWTDLNTSIADDDEVRFQIFGTELPVTITSNGGGADASISILENGNAVTAVAASGSNVVYSIAGGADAALLTINPATGALSFIASPNFESPSDTGTNNVYDLVVRASSGSAFDEQTISVTVDNLNEGLSITSASAFGLAENMNAIGAVSAADIDGDTVSYVISGGADAASFTIDALTGELSFINAPNFETPGDTGGDNIYDVIVAATDGNFTEMQSIAVTVANSDEAVIFQPANGFSIDENQLLIGSLLALDPDGVPVSYSIAGGADAALFGIDAVTGALSFLTAPDFEAPADADGDNVYDVSIAASDGTSSATQSVSVNLNNINEAPSITSNGGGATASLMVVENELAVTTVESADPEGNNRVYAITGGADAARFTIDATTGALAFTAAPNFEAPADAGANNIYDVTVSASDGVLTDVQALNITVTNTNEAPVITSNGGGSTTAISVNENGLAVTTIISTDAEGTPRTYSIAGGADAARFSINQTTGAVSFIAAPNFEAPVDVGGNNVYDVVISASDGINTTTQALAVAINNVRDGSTITGTNGGNTLTGTVAEDTINGRGGNDIITGGRGADIITGGTGGDRFVLTSVNDSLAASMDVITDFLRSQGDRISLSAIDANSNSAGDQAFTFIGNAAFSNVAGQLRYQQISGNTFVSGDVNGDGVADFMVQVNGLVTFQSSDFIL